MTPSSKPSDPVASADESARAEPAAPASKGAKDSFSGFKRRPVPARPSSDAGQGGAVALGKSTVSAESAAPSAADADADAAGTVSDAPDSTLPVDLIEVGVIGQAYGVRGQVKVFPHAGIGDGGSALLSARNWWLRGPRDSAPRKTGVRGARDHSGAVAATLAGCDDRDAAQALKGTAVLVRRVDFPALPDGEYYWVDLMGLAVVNPAGTALGHVRDLMDNSAHTVLRVAYQIEETPGTTVERERLIPFVDAYLREVDLAGRKIVVDWDVDY